jgi:hypothetical protein
MTLPPQPAPLKAVKINEMIFEPTHKYSRSKKAYIIELIVKDDHTGAIIKKRLLHSKQELEEFVQKYLGAQYQAPIW